MKIPLILLITFLQAGFISVFYPSNEKVNLKHYISLSAESNIFFNKYEISNGEYNLFLEEMKLEEAANYENYVYDDNLWVDRFPLAYNEPIRRNYHVHPAYENYPVVNISIEAAQAYCAWLTDKYQAQKRKKYKEVVFRLPNQEEFQRLRASANLQLNSDQPEDYKSFAFNLKFPRDYAADGATYTGKVSDYVQNKSRFCSIIGNVSELLDNGQAAGGNWDSFTNEVDAKLDYQAPDPRIGFRLVMEVIKE